MGKTLGILVAIIAVLAILASLAGGEETGSQAQKKLKDQQEAKKTPQQGNSGGQEPAKKPKLVVSSPSTAIFSVVDPYA